MNIADAALNCSVGSIYTLFIINSPAIKVILKITGISIFKRWHVLNQRKTKDDLVVTQDSYFLLQKL